MARARDDTVASIGEFGLIDRLRRLVPTTGAGVVLGVGDDAAVLAMSGPVVATCDIQIADVHFSWAALAPRDVGWRAIAVNLSDVAAMGGTPRFVLVSIALPPQLPVSRVEGIYEGMAEITNAFGVVVAGGNISSTPGPLAIDVTALGEAGRILTRGGARPGDRVWVTGALGKAAAGRFLAAHSEVTVRGRDDLVASFRRPLPRVEAARTLAAIETVTAMIDTSDGTASDLLHLAEASGVGVRLDAERMPLPPGAHEAAQAAGGAAAEWALAGGEDYELLWTAGPEFDPLAAGLADRLAVRFTCIGEVLPETAGRWVTGPGGRRPLVASGWDHFRGGGG